MKFSSFTNYLCIKSMTYVKGIILGCSKHILKRKILSLHFIKQVENLFYRMEIYVGISYTNFEASTTFWWSKFIRLCILAICQFVFSCPYPFQGMYKIMWIFISLIWVDLAFWPIDRPIFLISSYFTHTTRVFSRTLVFSREFRVLLLF